MKKKFTQLVLSVVTIAMLLSGCGQAAQNQSANATPPQGEETPNTDSPQDANNTEDMVAASDLIMLKEQGSFSVGGSVIEVEGTYESQNFNGWQPYPEGQTYHGDHYSHTGRKSGVRRIYRQSSFDL